MVLRRAARLPDGRVTMFTMMLNPTDEDRLFALPPPYRPARLLLDTAAPESDGRDLDPAAREITVPAQALVLLLSDGPGLAS